MKPGDRTPPSIRLALLEAFLNTSRDGADELATPTTTQRWLAARRLAPPHAEYDERDRRRLVEVRDALRQLVAADGGAGTSRRAVTILNEAARRIRLGVRVHPEDGYRLVAEGVGIERPVGDLLVGVMSAMAVGEWSRLKLCANDECRQAFIDNSRNRSARWCSMETCGNRMKGRAYRRRRASFRGRGAQPATLASVAS